MDERRVRIKPDNEYSVGATAIGIPIPKGEFNGIGIIVGRIPPTEVDETVNRYLVRFEEKGPAVFSFKPDDLIFEEPSVISPTSSK